MTAERTVVVPNTLGLHVRPSTAFAQTAAGFQSSVEVEKDGQVVDGKSVMALLTLAAIRGTRLTIRAHGPDAEQAVATLAAMIESGFSEE